MCLRFRQIETLVATALEQRLSTSANHARCHRAVVVVALSSFARTHNINTRRSQYATTAIKQTYQMLIRCCRSAVVEATTLRGAVTLKHGMSSNLMTMSYVFIDRPPRVR